ncbi:hypothetical protein [Acinetobacter venetianus]|uniref:hypothetical protein n=1 Tax=Acinetobacter venetianus TaxID=52133 RepID=UPI003A9302A9
MKTISIFLVGIALLSVGCSNEPRLGYHMAKVKQQQVYNPNATQENVSVIPDGNGERMEDVYSIYTGKKGEDLKGNASSQVLTGF